MVVEESADSVNELGELGEALGSFMLGLCLGTEDMRRTREQITLPLKYIEFKFVCAQISWDNSLSAMLLIAAMAALESLLWLPSSGLHGAKPTLVGKLSIIVHESESTAVATPFEVVSSFTEVMAGRVDGRKESI